MTDFAWVDGGFVVGDAIPATDRAFLHGVGLFETLGLWNGRLPLWNRHLARLEVGADVFGIRTAPPPGLHEAALELLARNRHDVVRVTLSAGDLHPRWVLTTRARVHARDPMVLAPSSFRRGPADPAASLKTTSRAFHELAQREAKAAGADEALLLGRGEEVLETVYGNVFLTLDDDELWTPEEDRRFLCGIARGVLLERLAARVMTRPIGLSELRRAKGIWITNAVHGPRRARLADEEPVGAPRLDDALAGAWEAVVGAG